MMYNWRLEFEALLAVNLQSELRPPYTLNPSLTTTCEQ